MGQRKKSTAAASVDGGDCYSDLTSWCCSSTSSRGLRAFKRWMKSQGIEWSSDFLHLSNVDDPQQQQGGGGGEGRGISVIALGDLKEGQVVASIPKSACLTIKTSGARQLIESAGLDGSLGLSVALMYERSSGLRSPWAPYLHLLPRSECLPLLWSLQEVDNLLRGTELHDIVKEDKALIYEDWKESIAPLLDSEEEILDPSYFGIDQYFAAKSLIASRSFQIDDYHGFGMVPLADLYVIFNHKTGAEDVHFTSVSSDSDSEDSNDSTTTDSSADNAPEMEPLSDSHYSSSMKMIMVKDVKAGAEVYNTYGLVGNAALLHRYGFTEEDNPYDIVNIDLELVVEWSGSFFSARHTRARLSFWRKLGYSGCVSQNVEYFEVSFNGEPQIELLILLYIILLPEDDYRKLDLAVSTANKSDQSFIMIFLEKCNIAWGKSSEVSRDLLLTESVCNVLRWLADKRESLYGSSSMKDDIEALKRCCARERKLYHSLLLRMSERRILQKLRTYAAVGARWQKSNSGALMGKRLRRT